MCIRDWSSDVCSSDRQDDLDQRVGRQTKQMVEAGVDLQHAETERRGDTKHGTEHGKDIDCVANRAVNPVADQRVERGADGEGQTAPEGKIGEGQPYDDVDRDRKGAVSGKRVSGSVELGDRGNI